MTLEKRVVPGAPPRRCWEVVDEHGQRVWPDGGGTGATRAGTNSASCSAFIAGAQFVEAAYEDDEY